MNEDSIIVAEHLEKYFDIRGSFIESIFSRGQQKYLKAVDDVSFEIKDGEIFGLVGESGCGKTTTGRLLMNTVKPTGGKVYFEGKDLSEIKTHEELKKLSLRMQMIFQDPYEYISPWLNIRDTLAEPLRIHNIVDNEDEEEDKIQKVMELVGLTPVDMILPKYSYELSGGQRQRVVVARALLLDPKFLVADEPVSMLDVSIRVGILNLLLDLQKKFNMTSLFITHDIAVSRYMCDRIGVMYLGKIVELGPTEKIITNPTHPYTQALISAVPVPDPKISVGKIPIEGRIPSNARDLPPGCRFHPRCPYAKEGCKEKQPELVEVENGHFVACHI
ncbi:ATP-binding cassette domain-containing protein [Candidatus Bathyarchaeota archaeon]|nr:ATP-binding cassette domain-containing protein [Candidatus Bathyarchaeota archaeon]